MPTKILVPPLEFLFFTYPGPKGSVFLRTPPQNILQTPSLAKLDPLVQEV